MKFILSFIFHYVLLLYSVIFRNVHRMMWHKYFRKTFQIPRTSNKMILKQKCNSEVSVCSTQGGNTKKRWGGHNTTTKQIAKTDGTKNFTALVGQGLQFYYSGLSFFTVQMRDTLTKCSTNKIILSFNSNRSNCINSPTRCTFRRCLF